MSEDMHFITSFWIISLDFLYLTFYATFKVFLCFLEFFFTLVKGPRFQSFSLMNIIFVVFSIEIVWNLISNLSIFPVFSCNFYRFFTFYCDFRTFTKNNTVLIFHPDIVNFVLCDFQTAEKKSLCQVRIKSSHPTRYRIVTNVTLFLEKEKF